MKCNQVKENGEQCKSSAMTSSDYCYFHNPAISEEEKKEAQARGGKNRSMTTIEPLSKVKIGKVSDVTLLLIDTINQVRSGNMNVKMANCVGFLSDKLVRTMEAGNLEERFTKLEQLVMSKTHK